MLELLSLRKGMTLTKEMFLNHLYGGMDEPSSRSSTSSLASYARSSPTLRMARTTSRRYGAAVTCCASQARMRRGFLADNFRARCGT